MSDPDDGSQRRRSAWRSMVANPVTLGALITGYVTLNTAIFGYLSARNSQNIEREKFEFQASLEERKYETSLILEIAKGANGDQQLMIRRLCVLMATGLIPQAAERLARQKEHACADNHAKTP